MHDLDALHGHLDAHVLAAKHHTRAWLRLLHAHGQPAAALHARLTSRGRCALTWQATDLRLCPHEQTPVDATRFRATYSLTKAAQALTTIATVLAEAPALGRHGVPLLALRADWDSSCPLHTHARIFWPVPGGSTNPQDWPSHTTRMETNGLHQATQALVQMSLLPDPQMA